MREILYKCNLCMEKKEYKDLLTVYYKCDILPQRFVLIPTKPHDHYDKQICHSCIEMIKTFELTDE